MTASDWGPDSPATTRFRAFYDWPAPVEFDAELPDDIDGPDDERDFLLDAAPFAKQRAVRVEPVVPASTVAQGATNTPNPDPSAIPSGNDGSGDLRAEVEMAARLALASVIHEAGCQCQGHKLGWTIRDRDAQLLAQGVLAAGYRLVSEDDTTVDRVARRVAAEALGRYDGDPSGLDWTSMGTEDQEEFRFVARAAVRALREDAQ